MMAIMQMPNSIPSLIPKKQLTIVFNRRVICFSVCVCAHAASSGEIERPGEDQ